MTQKKKSIPNVPKLRFPKFRDAREWDEKILSNLSACGLSNGVFNDPKKVGTGYKLINVSDMYIESTINESILSLVAISKEEFSKNKVENGDIFFTRSSLVKSGIAHSNIYLGHSIDITFDGHLIRFRPNIKIVAPIFINYLLKTAHVRKQLVARGKTATMTTIGQSDVGGVNLSIPHINEQQKIADCLASIDDRITAETQKLDTLKVHKKGLMQQLFPAEGETLPKLRFSEFLDTPEWDEKPLGKKTIKVGSGITPNGGDKNYKTKGRPFVRSQNIGWGCLLLDDVVFIDDATHSAFSATEINERDVFLNITGASIGRSAVADFRVQGGNVNQHVCIIRTEKSELNPYYLNQYLLSQYGQRQIDSFQAGGNRQGLNFAQVRSFSLPLPLIEEQQKIADCFSSLDELIAAQTQKIDTLKSHKKGLMQQLFPALDEVMK